MAPGFLFMTLVSKTPVCVNDREPPFMAPEVAALQRRQSSISHGPRTTPEQLQSKDLPLIATSRLDRELVNAHASVVIQLGALGSLGMVGGSTPLVLSGLALIFLVLIIASKHLLRKGASKERRSTMETKPNVNTNISLSKSVHEALHEFAVSFGAGFLGGTIPSITPLRLTA